jgi:Brp/Blh family beta-carotene 15,15'-monooxygenase
MIEGVIASLGLANLLALGSVVLIGLPHGAFDGAIAGYLGYTARPQWLLRFLGLYLLLAAAVVMIWMYFPVAALIGFLAISMIHFGLGDASAAKGWFRQIQAVSHGGIVVVAISQGHKQDVDQIFSYLVGGETGVVWTAIDVMSVVVAVALIVYAWQALWDSRWRIGLLELVALLSLFLLVPPLVGFAIYFCCVHSARHLLSVWRSINREMPRKSIYFQATFFTLASWAAGAVALYYCMINMSMESAIMQVVFIGLAALTVPHMLLVDGMFRRHAVRSAQG